MTKFLSPADWLPEYGLSQLDCIKASRTMAEFCVLACAEGNKTPLEADQLLGCFVVAADLSCGGRRLQDVIGSDLRLAGFDKHKAKTWAEELTTESYLEHIAERAFIRENLPKYGLRYGKAKDIDTQKFVKAILALGQTDS